LTFLVVTIKYTGKKTWFLNFLVHSYILRISIKLCKKITKEVTYNGMMEHFAKQARKKLKIICNNLKIMTSIDSNVKKIYIFKQHLA
jgi:hypothetical protein